MPGNYLLTPPEVIQEDDFRLFRSNPCEACGCRIGKCVINLGEGGQDERLPTIGGASDHNIAVFPATLVDSVENSSLEGGGRQPVVGDDLCRHLPPLTRAPSDAFFVLEGSEDVSARHLLPLEFGLGTLEFPNNLTMRE